MNRYNVKVAALQETKWFGSAMYRVGDSIVLAAGRPVPKPGENLQRGEGVAVVLSGPALKAWKDAGEQWKAWNSRLVSAQLRTGKREHGILRIVSCYMYQPEQLPGLRKTASMLISNRYWSSYHLKRSTLCLGTSMHVWGPGTVLVSFGAMYGDLVGMEN